MITNSVDFFMAANTPNGFYSLFDEFKSPKKDYISFLIKGGAGTGKSSLIKKIEEAVKDKESFIERIHCSSDTNSLDGLILKNANVSIVDSTSPHIIEPTYPGGYEQVINLIEYFDNEKLHSRLEQTVELQVKNNLYHKKCRSYLKAADLLLNMNRNISEEYTDYKKLNRFINKICNEYLKIGLNKPAKSYIRLLSAVTNNGIVVYENSISALSDRIYLIKDEYGVSSNYILSKIKYYALKKGYDVYSLMCPLCPTERLEHLIIPELQLSFVTENKFITFKDIVPYKVLLASRFIDKEKLKEHKRLIAFNFKLVNELLKSSIQELKLAKINHNFLEEQYSGCVDFKLVDKKTTEIINKIVDRY